jgi:hypothetical protein
MRSVEQETIVAKLALMRLAKHQSVTEQPEHCAGYTQINQFLNRDIDAILGAH